MGSNGNDTLIADNAGRFLFALNGEDQLKGGDKVDVLDFNSGNSSLVNDRAIGGGGNDTIRINWEHISKPEKHDHQTLIDGGKDRDTLEIYGSVSIDLTNLRSLNGGGADYSHINSIEVINLRNVTNIQSVKVTKEVIQGLVDEGSPAKLELVIGNRNVTFDFGADQEVNQFASGRVEFLSGNNVVAELQINYI
jgi:Ca2+-binding RTX toxin-like protein